ncbi:MAG TPA: TonB family protein [Longimicrobium sp.]|nr:TonB family protein [Longimicrobium sp.]
MSFRRFALPLLAISIMAAPARAQDTMAALGYGGREWFDNMELVLDVDPATGTDRSWAAVTDSSGGVILYWLCVDLDMYIQLEPFDAAADTRLTWRFDQDEPRTVAGVPRTDDSLGVTVLEVPREEHDPFTARAKTARRLAVWMPAAGGRREVVFDLRGAAPALGRLPCLLSKSPPGAGEYALGDARPWLDDPDFRETDDAPQLQNLEEVSAAMQESYPEALFDKGGQVILVLRVERDGTPNLPSVRVRSSTHAAFTRVALQVAPVMRFTPARRDGRDVPGWVQVPLDFLPNP